MPHFISAAPGRISPPAAVALVVLASLMLAACAGAPKGSTSSTGAGAPSRSTSDRPTGAAGGRFLALRECLHRHGITLPTLTPGVRPAPGSRGPALPKGVSRAHYEATVRKCGGIGLFGGARGRYDSPAIKQALAKFAACMREHGVNVPQANTSGKGPIFNSKGLDTSATKFKLADAKCRVELQGAFRGAPGARVAPGGPGAPPPTG